MIALLVFACGEPMLVRSLASEMEDSLAAIEADLTNRTPTSDLSGVAMEWEEARQRFFINRENAVFRFNSGPSYFRTIALPKDSPGKRLEVKSYYGSDDPVTVLVPALIFLNAESEIIETLPKPMIEIINEKPEHIFVSEMIPEDAAFAVVYTSEDRVNTLLNFNTYALSRHSPSPRIGSGNPKLFGFYEGILSLSIGDP